MPAVARVRPREKARQRGRPAEGGLGPRVGLGLAKLNTMIGRNEAGAVVLISVRTLPTARLSLKNQHPILRSHLGLRFVGMKVSRLGTP